MINNKRILAFVPARKGSKGLPGKNVIDFAGKPLITHTFDLIKNIREIDQCLVSTDSQEIISLSLKYGFLNNGLRPNNLSDDKSIIYDVIKYELAQNLLSKNFDILIILQPTSPLRNLQVVKSAIYDFCLNNLESSIGVHLASENPILIRKMIDNRLHKIIDFNSTVRRQDFEKYYVVNGSIYINWIRDVMNKFVSFNDNIHPIIFSLTESIDIDTKEDLDLALKFYNNYYS
jgi:CMP-N-acetylneuraminic acid synthetase